jgi:hypothetical protein
MGGLIFFAIFIAWFCFCVWLAHKVIRARKSIERVNCKLAMSNFIVLIGMSLISGCEKFELDRRMEDLCKKDGGVRVYETVNLPPEMFDQNGDPFPGWRKRKSEDRLGTEYLYNRAEEVLKDGDPLKGQGRLIRIERQIIRRSDEKLLGASVFYGRSGGDFIAFDHFTSKGCPANQSSNDVINQVFIKQGK